MAQGKTRSKPVGYNTRLVMVMVPEMRELKIVTDRIFAQFEALAKAEGVSVAFE